MSRPSACPRLRGVDQCFSGQERRLERFARANAERPADDPTGLSRMHAGERFNVCTHLLGLALAVLAVPMMLAKTLPGGDAAKIAGALVFALSCVALYAASTFSHSTRGEAKVWWQRVDHCAIYLLIAGSFTPFALVTLRGTGGWLLLAGAWGIALLGIGRELRSTTSRPALELYVGMGWIGVVAAALMASRIEVAGLVWLLGGAVLYTVGTIFYVNRAGLRHAHGIWHLFVLGGTASHYVAIAGFVV